MIWLHGLLERDHDVQDPISPEKLRAVSSRLRLRAGDRVLDVGAGRCGPALLLAAEHGCEVTAVEQYDGFVAGARARAEAAGVAKLLHVVHADGAAFPAAGEVYDAAYCLGATTYVYGSFPAALERLASGVRPGGHVVVGEVYGRTPGVEFERETLRTLDGLLGEVTAAGLRPVTVVTASGDDWDTYNSLRMLALEDWLDANQDHPEAAEVAAARPGVLAQYLLERTLGWAVIAARVP